MASTSPIVRRINAERLVLSSWTRAILLQVAHPLVAAGVANHSSFRTSAAASAQRLHHTVRAMLNLTFGADEQQARALEGIRTIHRRVHGTTRAAVGRFPAGTAYSAEDPELLCWVHVTLLDSAVLAYEALVAPLSSDDRDAYCRDTAWVAIALGARGQDVPLTWADLRARFDGTVASTTLAVGDDALVISRAILRSRLSWLIPFSGWLNERLTAGWLPSTLRAEYRLAWGPEHERQFHRAVNGLRHMRHALPSVAAHWRSARR